MASSSAPLSTTTQSSISRRASISSSSPLPQPPLTSTTTSTTASASPSLFMCCVSLPGPLQPLTIAYPPSPSSSPSSSSSSPTENNTFPSLSTSTATAGTTATHAPSSLPTLSEIAQLHPHPDLHRNQVGELLFRRRKKLTITFPFQQTQSSKNKKTNSKAAKKLNETYLDDIKKPQTQLQPPCVSQNSKSKTAKEGKQTNDSRKLADCSYNEKNNNSRYVVGANYTKNNNNSNSVSVKPDDVRRSWELLKSGEVSNLIKQGFMERTQRRLSPGRVSPLVHDTITASTEKSMSPLHAVSSTTSVTNIRSYCVDSSHVVATLPSLSPPSTLPNKPAKSNTLFDMMAKDAEMRAQPRPSATTFTAATNASISSSAVLERSRSSRANVTEVSRVPVCYENCDPSDVRVILRSKDGGEVSLNLHRNLLVEKSRFFAARLSDGWCKQRQIMSPYILEIRDCEDLEVYQETLQLLYCQDLQSMLIKHSVSRVLAILKVAALILFEPCIVACLEFLEAAPWAEDEEDKIRSLLSQLHLENVNATEVLKRLKNEENSGSEETLVRLVQMVIRGKDNKARREMKALVSKMLRENASQNKQCRDLSKESLYNACNTCLDALLKLFMQTANRDFKQQGNEDRSALLTQTAHQADNLQWLLEILLDRHIAGDFVKMWASQAQLAGLHKQVPPMLRYEVSHLTARLCVAIGKGQVLCPVDVRHMLLQTWLPPLLDDFGWMRRCCKCLDKNVVEEGISQTVLTLPLKQQQSILLAWFDRFSNNADDCPNLQRAFEVWWRRTFVRPTLETQGAM